ELLHAGNVALTEGDAGLLDFSDILEKRYGSFTTTLFLIGFFAASYSSLIGVWHGVSLLFADFVERVRAGDGGRAATQGTGDGVKAVAAGEREKSLPFRLYVLWLTFPPMALLWLEQPFGLVIAYGVLGAFFLPFLAGTLLWLLNSSRTPREWRNGILSNVMLTVAGLLFIVLCVNELVGMF
ncbi:MAG: Nramp family divalent metal transporter, partial [Micromonosporaceae bacterium]